MNRAARASTRVVYGDAALGEIVVECRRRGWRKIMLVCGRTSFEASGAAAMLPDLEAVASVTPWSGFAPNPDSRVLHEGLLRLRDIEPDAVVGVGGGSAMDMAKLLAGFAGDDPGATEALVRGERAGETRRVGLCLAPTTSGSGSEATHFAVVYIGEDKFSVVGTALYADLVVLDPGLAVSGSPRQRAGSGIDAVCQAIESLWAGAADERSRRVARHALRLLLPCLASFVEAPDARSARAMCLGSHLAGRAIDTSRTTAAHALSYALTKRYGVDHGAAVALTLAPLMEVHAAAAPPRLRPGTTPEQHAAAVASILRALGAGSGEEAARRFRYLLTRIGLPTRLAEVGLTSADARQQVARSVNLTRLGNNPVALSEDDLIGILERAA